MKIIKEQLKTKTKKLTSKFVIHRQVLENYKVTSEANIQNHFSIQKYQIFFKPNKYHTFS